MAFSAKTKSSAPPTNNAHRANLLYEATLDFCNQRGRDKNTSTDQYTKLFYSLIGDSDTEAKKLMASHLARCNSTPRAIAYYLAMETIEIAAPFLLISPVLWERDLIQLAGRLGVSHLCAIARRADITPNIAQAVIARKNKLSCQILLRNPALKLNAVAKTQQSEVGNNSTSQNDNNGRSVMNEKPHLKASRLALLDLANIESGNKSDSTKKAESGVDMLERRLFDHAKSNNMQKFISEICEHTGIAFGEIERIVRYKGAMSVAIIFKSLGISQSDACQLAININVCAANNISGVARFKEHYNRFDSRECQDIMKNLAAKKLQNSGAWNSSVQSVRPTHQTKLENVASARRRQIMSPHSPSLFGNRRKTG